MAAYAAVVSLIHLMEQVQSYCTSYLIFHDGQKRQLESLREKVSSLIDFLESNSLGDSDGSDNLESRIIDAAHAAEDVIELYIVDDIHARKIQGGNNGANVNLGMNASDQFSLDVQKVIEHIESIRKELQDLKDQSNIRNDPQIKETEQPDSMQLPNIGNDTVVGLDDMLTLVMEKLTEHHSSVQVIAMTGMGGSGKSTLAKKAYDSLSKRQHFDVSGWVTISQEFNVKDVLLGLLRETGCPTYDSRDETEYYQLGEQLHKHLSGRRFFVVIDDIWSLDAWNKIKLYLPDNGNRSRIVITTRLSNLVDNIGASHTFKMKLLDEDESWNLLCSRVFGKEKCPPELEEVGKGVAINCRGLPLSIVVLGGLLRKSITREYWEYVKEDTSASVNSDENERCLKILQTSYCHLPIHLKPCFIYLGVFPEDHEIHVKDLVLLWVAEGFLKANKSKCLEEVAVDYLKHLIDRNLIFVTKLGVTGNVKVCRVHDLLRDLCLREARKKRFFCFTKTREPDIPGGFNGHSRLVMFDKTTSEEFPPPHFHAFKSSSFLRSLISNFSLSPLSSSDVKLLRVSRLQKGLFSMEDFSELVNSRYLNFNARFNRYEVVPTPSLVYFHWNMQTLIVMSRARIPLPSEIWKKSQLRHIKMTAFTLEDPRDGEDNVVLENLHTLSGLYGFRCSEEVLRKAPNVKKLKLGYHDEISDAYLKNLGRLDKLESLNCFSHSHSIAALEYSLSLRRLVLQVPDWKWEDSGARVGLLPHLEKFKLSYTSGGDEWNSVEGHFVSLKYLCLSLAHLVRWTVENDSFPCLEHLDVTNMYALEEIPYEIGELPTLQTIDVSYSCDSAVESAKMILDEQRFQGNDNLVVIMKKY